MNCIKSANKSSTCHYQLDEAVEKEQVIDWLALVEADWKRERNAIAAV